jgi:hypothetical protein
MYHMKTVDDFIRIAEQYFDAQLLRKDVKRLLSQLKSKAVEKATGGRECSASYRLTKIKIILLPLLHGSRSPSMRPASVPRPHMTWEEDGKVLYHVAMTGIGSGGQSMSSLQAIAYRQYEEEVRFYDSEFINQPKELPCRE